MAFCLLQSGSPELHIGMWGPCLGPSSRPGPLWPQSPAHSSPVSNEILTYFFLYAFPPFCDLVQKAYWLRESDSRIGLGS